jgi:hypothetical protein
MKLDDLLALAKATNSGLWRKPPAEVAGILAEAIVDLLGEGSTCGVEPFEILDGELVIGDTQVLELCGRMSPAGAREYARLLFRGADAAEAEQ